MRFLVRSPAKKRVQAILYLPFMIASAAAQSQTQHVESLTGRNLVVVVVDSLRADRLGVCGYARPTSPFMDSLARGGLLFTDAASNSSYISQSLSALFTGRLPTSAGTVGMDEAHPLDETRTLPEIFRRSGYRTAIATNQSMIHGRGFTKGFDDVQIGPRQDPWSDVETTRRALEFIGNDAEKPFMLYVHYAGPHQPYDPAPEHLGKFEDAGAGEPVNLSEFRARYRETAEKINGLDDPSVRALVARYDAEIAAADHAIAKLVQGIASAGLTKNTVVLVTSSHGEEFFEHGYVGHGWTLYEETIRVPLILWAPGAVPSGRVRAPVSHVDLLPTIIALFSLSTRRTDFDGESLVVAAGGGFDLAPPKKPRIAELVIPGRCVVRSVTQEGWKYTAWQAWVAPADRYAAALSYIDAAADHGEPPPLWSQPVFETVHRLADDPREQAGVRDADREKLDALRAALEAYRSYCMEHGLTPRPRERKAPVLEMEQTEDLESLGYL